MRPLAALIASGALLAWDAQVRCPQERCEPLPRVDAGGLPPQAPQRLFIPSCVYPSADVLPNPWDTRPSYLGGERSWLSAD